MSGADSSENEAGDGLPDGDEPTVPQAGVLGNLPKTRPSVRSPRRKEQKPAKPAGAEPESAAKSRKRPAEPTERVEARRPPTEPASEPTPEASPGNPAADLDALARGGIAIAGEAASLGLRIAGRAAAALRDAVERR